MRGLECVSQLDVVQPPPLAGNSVVRDAFGRKSLRWQ